MKALHTKSENYQKALGYKIEYLENGNILVYNGCEIHGDIELTPRQFNNRTKAERKEFTTLCPVCNPERNPETSIETITKSILNELNVKFEQHNRKIIAPKELDFYLPFYNLAIECNGVFWHSLPEVKDKQYVKFKQCEEKGVQLLQFWENDLQNKKEIIKDIIFSKLKLNKRIFARKCQLKEISKELASEFLNENHLLGSASNLDLNLGLFYKDSLVEIMSFERLKKEQFALTRFCSKIGISVIGGISKLFTHFVTTSNPKEIFTKSYNDFSNGSIYNELGFSLEKETIECIFFSTKASTLKCFNSGTKFFTWKRNISKHTA